MNMKKVLSAALAVAMVATMSANVFALPLTGDNLAETDGTLNIEQGTFQASGGDAKEYYMTEATTEGASSVVTVTSEATMFKVTVPIKLHVTQKANADRVHEDAMVETPVTTGSVQQTATGTAKIINECPLGQVKITSVKVVPTTNYTISDFDADFANMKVNSKTFGMTINGQKVSTSGGTVVENNTATDTITSEVKSSDRPEGYADRDTDAKRVYGDYTFTRSGSSAFPVIAHGSVLPINYEIKLPGYSEAVTSAVYGGVVYTFDFNVAE